VDEDGKVTGYIQPMPYTPSTKITSVWPGDLGVVFFAIVQGGVKFYGKTIAVAAEEARDDDRLATWAKGRSPYSPQLNVIPPSNAYVIVHSPRSLRQI
jgi:hypothetical protein